MKSNSNTRIVKQESFDGKTYLYFPTWQGFPMTHTHIRLRW